MKIRLPDQLRPAALACGLAAPWLAGAMLLAACAAGPDFARPPAPQVAQYTHGDLPASTIAAAGQAQSYDFGSTPSPTWWHSFQSHAIDGMVDQALQGNATLAAAEASLRRNQDSLRAGYGVFFPQADLGLAASRERSAPALQGLAVPGSIFNVFTLSGSIAYAVDVFGGQRRAVEGLKARAETSRHEAEAARLALEANVVETAIARAAYASQMEATSHLLALQQLLLQQAEAQFKAGMLGYANVAAARSQLALTEAQFALLKQKYDQAGHLLVNLQGDFAGRMALPEMRVEDISLPSALPVSLPAELVHRRPDILAAEASLHAASADIGVATAAMFPAMALTGDAGQAGDSLRHLSGDGGRFWSGGAALQTPLLRGGSQWFGRKAAIDAYDGAAATYRQTVLDAFTQVADCLKALEHDAEALQAQNLIEEAADDERDLVWANYNAGLISLVDVLNAEVQATQAEISRTAAVAQRLQDSVALVAATGGGWQAHPGGAGQAVRSDR